jgi:hypothetical protein
MNARQIRDMLQADPFRPFRLVAESGKTYDVLDPSQISLSQREIAVSVDDKGGHPAETMVFVPLDEIVAIQPIAFA